MEKSKDLFCQSAVLRGYHHLNGRRKRHNRRRKDDRHNAGSVYLDRQVGGLTTVLLAADDALCVLDRDSSLSIRDIDDEDDDCQTDEYSQGSHENACAAVFQQLHHGADQSRTTGNDACEQDDADAVADTVLGDVLTEPHDQSGTSSKCQYNDQTMPEIGVLDQSLGTEQYIVSVALDQTEGNTQITGDGGHLLAAFVAALTNHALECRNGNCEQLEDDGCVDVRSDRHREDGRSRQTAAGEHIHITKHRGRHLVKVLCQRNGVDIRNRNRGADPENQKNEQRIRDLLAKFRNVPGVS